MPLSKKDNRDRMRQSRLHKQLSPPQESNPVQPKAPYGTPVLNIVESGDRQWQVRQTQLENGVEVGTMWEVDADGNPYG